MVRFLRAMLLLSVSPQLVQYRGHHKASVNRWVFGAVYITGVRKRRQE